MCATTESHRGLVPIQLLNFVHEVNFVQSMIRDGQFYLSDRSKFKNKIKPPLHSCFNPIQSGFSHMLDDYSEPIENETEVTSNYLSIRDEF